MRSAYAAWQLRGLDLYGCAKEPRQPQIADEAYWEAIGGDTADGNSA